MENLVYSLKLTVNYQTEDETLYIDAKDPWRTITYACYYQKNHQIYPIGGYIYFDPTNGVLDKLSK